MLRAFILVVCAFAAASCASRSAPFVIPFDYSRTALDIDVAVKGEPMHMLLDTGVDPSVIDASTAARLGLEIDRGAGGEASGIGNAAQATVYPTTLEGLSIAGRAFGAVDALAADLTAMSDHYGRRLDGVLGYSFLKDKIVLIDYAQSRIELLKSISDAAPEVRACRQTWSTPMQFAPDDNTPLIAAFRFGDATGPITLDTGSNGGVSIFQSALALPGVRAALTPAGEVDVAGARGSATVERDTFNAPLGFGPFRLPPGQTVTVRDTRGSLDTRVGNVGNQFFAGLRLKMLLDYRDRQMTFYGACS